MWKVLIVDDSGTMRRVLMRCLSGLDRYAFEFDEATDGMDAIAKFAKTAFDLVVCDINMPKLDGVGLVRALRREALPAGVSAADWQTTDDVPVLVVSTEGTNDRVEEAIMAGANGFLPKPFTPAQLSERLAQLL